MASTVPKGDFVVVLKRALRDKETRELVAKELALYDAKEGPSGASTSRTPKTKQEDETERLLAEFAKVSLEERVLDLERTVAKQEAKIKAQGEDLIRLWELMEREVTGHHGALGALLSFHREYKVSSGDEGEGKDSHSDSDQAEERANIPVQTATRGRPKQTARKSWPRGARGGRNI